MSTAGVPEKQSLPKPDKCRSCGYDKLNLQRSATKMLLIGGAAEVARFILAGILLVLTYSVFPQVRQWQLPGGMLFAAMYFTTFGYIPPVPGNVFDEHVCAGCGTKR